MMFFFGRTTLLIIMWVRDLPLSRGSSSASCKRGDNSSYLSHTRSVCTHPPSLALQPTHTHSKTPLSQSVMHQDVRAQHISILYVTRHPYRNKSLVHHAGIHLNCREIKTCKCLKRNHKEINKWAREVPCVPQWQLGQHPSTVLHWSSVPSGHAGVSISLQDTFVCWTNTSSFTCTHSLQTQLSCCDSHWSPIYMRV